MGREHSGIACLGSEKKRRHTAHATAVVSASHGIREMDATAKLLGKRCLLTSATAEQLGQQKASSRRQLCIIVCFTTVRNAAISGESSDGGHEHSVGNERVERFIVQDESQVEKVE